MLANRAKLAVGSKIQSAKGHGYNQPEGALGEAMIKYGRKFGEDSNFGQSLIEMGEALRQMSEVKFALEDSVKQNFLEPLTHLQSKDIRDVMVIQWSLSMCHFLKSHFVFSAPS